MSTRQKIRTNKEEKESSPWNSKGAFGSNETYFSKVPFTESTGILFEDTGSFFKIV